MSISYKQVLSDHRDYLDHLASPDTLSFLEHENVAGIAAVREAEEGNELAGLMEVLRRKDDTAELLWLYVERAYRGKGIAGGFLDLLLDEAKKNGIKRLEAELYPKHMEEGFLMRDMADFLAAKWKTKAQETEGPWVLSRAELLSEPFLEKAASRLDGMDGEVVSLDTLSNTERRAALCAAPGGKRTTAETAWELSFAVRNEDAWKGLLLTERYGDTCEPVFLGAPDKQRELQLIFQAALTLSNKLGPDEYLKVSRRLPEMDSWMGKLLEHTARQKAIRLSMEIG